jgi:selenide,water dikinase
MYDPQTSGGLLLAVARDREPEVMAALAAAAVPAHPVGEVLPAGENGPNLAVLLR